MNRGAAVAFVKFMVIKRFAKPVVVSHVVVFPASERAGYRTGGEYAVNGGLLTGAGC